MQAVVQIYESRIVLDANGHPVRQAAQPVGTLTVAGETVDQRRAAAMAAVRKRTGKRASVMCCPGGGFVATYTVGPAPARVTRR